MHTGSRLDEPPSRRFAAAQLVSCVCSDLREGCSYNLFNAPGPGEGTSLTRTEAEKLVLVREAATDTCAETVTPGPTGGSRRLGTYG